MPYINLDQHNRMGFEYLDYPIPLNTAIIHDSQSREQFRRAKDLCLANQCEKLISPIFSDSYLSHLSTNHQALSLDYCYITSDQSFLKEEYRVFCPRINSCIWDKQFAAKTRVEILKTIFGYAGFLMIDSVALDLTGNEQIISSTLLDIAKSLEKIVKKIILIISIDSSSQEEGNTSKNNRIWDQYIQFRETMGQAYKGDVFELALIFQSNLPQEWVIKRWKSEQVYLFGLRSQCFTSNSKGYTILPARHERIMLEYVRIRGTVTLNVNTLDSHHAEEGLRYINYVYRKMVQNTLRSQKDALNLVDYLQDPLQPYADDLESMTYQIFENDETKYNEYQGALEQALQKFTKKERVVIYYIGAGRGALLFNAFAAAKKTQRKVFIYAIEKNLYPIQTIKKRAQENRWSDHLQIVYSDIRDYEMPEKPSIFLSELLGGFGDNELAPECLCWAEKQPIDELRNITADTICIPQEYSSFIRPVSYQGVHRKLRKEFRQIYYTTNFGTCFTNFESVRVWQFEHPLQNGHKDFNRESNKFEFKAAEDIVVNGFAGYFSSTLYGNAQLSILPEKLSVGSYSWFPIYFPFIRSAMLRKNDSIWIQIWRKHENQRVWYQWQYWHGNEQSPIHNRNGQQICIQL